MSTEWQEDMSDSSRLLRDVVWSEVAEWFGNGELILIEGRGDELSKTLDRLAGVDAFYIDDDRGIQTIASRVQQNARGHRTFTVRLERDSGARTELAKRATALGGGWLSPHWTVHGYASWPDEEFLNAAVCRTADLVQYVQTGQPEVDYERRETNNRGAAEFAAVHWGDLLRWPNRDGEVYVCDPSELTFFAGEEQATLPESAAGRGGDVS